MEARLPVCRGQPYLSCLQSAFEYFIAVYGYRIRIGPAGQEGGDVRYHAGKYASLSGILQVVEFPAPFGFIAYAGFQYHFCLVPDFCFGIFDGRDMSDFRIFVTEGLRCLVVSVEIQMKRF